MNVTRSNNKDFALIRIDSITIGTRFRKNLGDIASLAEDIREIGLLHPIVINQNHELICGLRRIEAFKSLVKSEIPAHIVNLDDIVKGEISENTQRKDFSLEEIIQIKKAVEPEIKTESKKRKLSGKPSANFAEGSKESNNNITTPKNYSENQTRAQVAKYVSSYGKKISHATLAKAEKVYDAAQQDPAAYGQIWTDLKSEKISPDKAYREMQRTQTGPDEIGETQPQTNNDITPANQAGEKDNKITQPQKELDEHISSASKQNEATRYVSCIPMPFEALQKDMTAVFRTNNGKVANVFFKVSVDLEKHAAQIECCGITQQKDITMISIGKGELKVAAHHKGR